MYVCMNGYMDGWVGRPMADWLAGWMDGRMDVEGVGNIDQGMDG